MEEVREKNEEISVEEALKTLADFHDVLIEHSKVITVPHLMECQELFRSGNTVEAGKLLEQILFNNPNAKN